MTRVAIAIIDTYPLQNFARYAISETCKISCVSKIHTFSKNPIFPGAIFHPIDNISSSSSYSDFVINVLPYFIHEEFVLLIQWDGFSLNPHLWDNNFFKYDYIGAPWTGINEDVSVGNGGFSLRSKLFLEASKKLEITPNDNSYEEQAEDMLLCRIHRLKMQEMGIRYAPVEIASKFSYEAIPREDSLGFHGIFNLPRTVKEEFLIENIDELLSRVQADDALSILIANSISLGKLEFAAALISKVRLNPNRSNSLKKRFADLGLQQLSGIFA